MARTAAQESSKRSCKGNTACNRGFPHGVCFGFCRTEEPAPKSTNWIQDLRHCSPWFTILHLQPISMASPSVWWVSLEPVRCCGLHERCCPHTRTQCSANSMSAFELILRWFGANKKWIQISYHQLVTIWIRINSSYLKLLTHSSDANWPSQGSAFSSVLIQQPEMDVCCFLGVFQPWARGQGLLILPQLGPTVEKAVLPNSHT